MDIAPITSRNYLRIRFTRVWNDCKIAQDGVGPTPWKQLERYYDEPHRHYHDLGHVTFCLKNLDLVKDRLPDPRAAELAIWFHDVIYRPGSRSDEEDSKNWFFKNASGVLKEEIVADVCRLILATKHDHVPDNLDEQFICDVDLSSFGVDWKTYLADSAGLRLERADQSDVEFYTSKIKFLTMLKNRERIFSTDFFREILESRARQNIERYLEQIVRLH